MAQIKQMPTHIREYYKAMRDVYTLKKDKAEEEKKQSIEDTVALREKIMDKRDKYLSYGINVSTFSEFINNEYEDGHFLRIARGAYLNRKNNYELTSDLYDLLKLADKQFKIHNLNISLEKYNKILSVKANDYIMYIRTFFNEVHKKMILEGYAYHYGNNIGDVVINRVKVNTNRKTLDYKATKLRKAEILAKGGRVYNKKEAEFCQRNGIEYNAEDPRVYLTDEFYYEIFLTNKKFHNANKFEFEPQVYKAVNVRDLNHDKMIEKYKDDLPGLCELPIDLKTKVILCNKIDKMLYTNFIRNENQTSYRVEQTDR